MSDQIFGIDLGTTNSCLAVMESGGPRVVEIDGQPTVPSVVSIDPRSGEIIVGTRARNRRALYPESTVSSIKRRMGESEPIRLGEQELLPEEVSAEILRYLKLKGGEALGQEVRRAVITVPAYFEDAQRRATIRAGELAGLEVVRIINEPTAASLVYERLAPRQISATDEPDATARALPDEGSGASGQRTLLVYDLGGGTFDVSLVRLDGEIYEVRASCGDTRLGGDDFDQLLVEHLLEAIEADGAAEADELRSDSRAMARLRDAAEQTKIELSSRPFVEIMEEALTPSLNLQHELPRRVLESLIEPKLGQTVAAVDKALDDAGMLAEQIDRVVLVGGSTRIPRVLELLDETLERPVEHSLDPDLCVAMGAAIQGAILAGEAFDRILIDVSAHSLGIRATTCSLIEHEHDSFATIIPRNTQVPTTRSEVFFTSCDDQDAAQIAVFQGEQPLCSDNTKIGDFMFDLEPAPIGSELVVELSYDLEGIIHVVVDQKGTGHRGEVTMSTRQESLAPQDTSHGDQVDNFIIRKARRLATEITDPELCDQLSSAATAYADGLADESSDPARLDQLEDELLELIEQAEEHLEDEQEA